MQIQGIAPWHGSGIKLAQERLVVETYGLRKVFEGFPLTVHSFFYLLTPSGPEKRANLVFYKVFARFWRCRWAFFLFAHGCVHSL